MKALGSLLLLMAAFNTFMGVTTTILPSAQLDTVLTPEELRNEAFKEQILSYLNTAHRVHIPYYYGNAVIFIGASIVMFRKASKADGGI